jgi:hypothetical protein
MQTNLQTAITDFPKKVIAQSGLTDLPAARRKTLRENLQNLLMSRILNALLSHLDESQREKFATEAETAEEMQTFFITLFQNIPNAEEIISEETEIFLEELTSNGL